MAGLIRTRRPMRWLWVCGAVLALSACPRSPQVPSDAAAPVDAALRVDRPAPADLAVQDAAPVGDQAAACPVHKIAFTQEQGCQNDGSNEFCVPSTDAATRAAVQRIAPAVTCGAGRGRAGCDPTTQRLCSFPTGDRTCTGRHGALTDSAWSQHCQIAALPAIPRIVHTWFE